MKTLKIVAAIGLGAIVSACSSMPDIASRNAPFETAPQLSFQQVEPGPQSQMLQQQSVRVSAINVRVPRSLTVSEANAYYPRADIVWRGDPIGDRHVQVQKIFEQSFLNGTKDMAGGTDVVLDVEVTRFHSVSEKTRYSVGGVHNMEFNLTVRSATTGLPLSQTRQVQANLPAFGGKQALHADRMGQTQKVRVSAYLAEVIRQELAKPAAAPAPKRKLASLSL